MQHPPSVISSMTITVKIGLDRNLFPCSGIANTVYCMFVADPRVGCLIHVTTVQVLNTAIGLYKHVSYT